MSREGDSSTGAEVVLVVTLGKSSGASTIAAGLAVAKVGDGQRVVLAELDPTGGELTERIVIDGWPRTRRDATVPPGARELADHLDAATLGIADLPAVVGDDRPLLRRFLVTIGNVPELAVLLGDQLVDGARRAAQVIGPHLGRLGGDARFDTVVIDGGRWTSADPDRLDGVDLVYAVAEGSSASQNYRCLAEARSLWRQLRARNPAARMVVPVVRSAWPAQQLLDLYQPEQGPDGTGYRVVVLDLDDHGQHAAARLAAARWAGIDPRGLEPFANLASPIGTGRRRPQPQGQPASEVVDEYAYLDTGQQTPPARPAHQPKHRPTWPFGDATGPAGDRPVRRS